MASKIKYGVVSGVDFDTANEAEIAATITATTTDEQLAVIADAMESAAGRERARKARETMAKQQISKAAGLRAALLAAAGAEKQQTRKR